ncbi:MAG: BMC domain-containing protein [Cyanobacteriota bacterium]
MKEICIGLLEVNSIAVGIKCIDEMAKKAPVKIIEAMTICPGKYIILITGEVAAVEESMKIGKLTASYHLIDELFLPTTHHQVYPAITGTSKVDTMNSLGIIETFSVASAIIAADKAAKTADVTLITLRLATGLGGKAFVTLTGDISEVEAAVDAGADLAGNEGLLVKKVVIPAPHEDITKFIL